MADPSELLDLTTAHYLSSGNFNGYPLRDLHLDREGLGRLIRDLVESEKLSLNLGSAHPNPYIKAFPPAHPSVQLDLLARVSSLDHVTAYPESRHLHEVVATQDYDRRPFTLRLALGAPQLLPPAFFDLMVLETYRNDPRYAYWSNEMSGRISVSDAFYQSEEMRGADQVLLETFGFGFDSRFHRVVCAFPIYLSRLSPEHQQIWAARELSGSHKIHPAYFDSSIRGEFPEREPIFSAFLEELNQLQMMSNALGLPPLVRSNFQDAKPPNFTFLIRPTLKELQDFHATLDKLMSENLNKRFFAKQLARLETETIRDDGRIVVTQKGTIMLLEEWLGRFRTDDRAIVDGVIDTFREVRRLRQRPAHAADDNRFDLEYYDQQRALVRRAYSAVRVLRLVLANHPRLKDYDGVPDWLQNGEIYDF